MSSGRLQEVKKKKNNENFNDITSKSGRGRLREVVVYESVQLQGFDWEKMAVLDRWSLMGDGRLQEVLAHGGSTVNK